MCLTDDAQLQSNKVAETKTFLSESCSAQQDGAAESRVADAEEASENDAVLTPVPDYTAAEDSSAVLADSGNDLISVAWANNMQVHLVTYISYIILANVL